MRPFRKNVALAIDGGGIKGVMVARALSVLEESMGRPVHDIFRLAAGTSTGSIISAGMGAGLTGAQMHSLYVQLGDTVFRKTWRSAVWPLTRYRYSPQPLVDALNQYIGRDRVMGDFWTASPPTDVVITIFDAEDNHTRMVKPWKPEYASWPVVKAVLASASVPTYFPAVDGRYVDGGVGSYANPCYLAAYELALCLDWDPAETTLISLGTGRSAHVTRTRDLNRLWAWEWISPTLGGFLQSADDQQVHLVRTFFTGLDFRRFQVDFEEQIEMDDPGAIPALTRYGDQLARKILDDEFDEGVGPGPTRVVMPSPAREGKQPVER